MLRLTTYSTNTLMTKNAVYTALWNLLGRELLLPNRTTTAVGDVNPIFMVVLLMALPG